MQIKDSKEGFEDFLFLTPWKNTLFQVSQILPYSPSLEKEILPDDQGPSISERLRGVNEHLHSLQYR